MEKVSFFTTRYALSHYLMCFFAKKYTFCKDPRFLMGRDHAGAVPALVAARAGQLSALNLLLKKNPKAAKSVDKVGQDTGNNIALWKAVLRIQI